MPSNERPEISFIVVSWNTRDLLRACLAGVRREAMGLIHEILVVDNASEDGSADMVAQEFPSVRLLRNRTNRGFGGACYQAIGEARGLHLMLLNPDAEPLDRAPAALVAFLDAHPDVGVVGPLIVNGSDEPGLTYGYYPSVATALLPLLRPLGGLFRGRWDLHALGVVPASPDPESPARDVDYVSGAALTVRREAVEQVGGFDDRFFLYFEETDLCRRIRLSGRRVVYLPAARVRHHEGASRDKRSVPAMAEFYRSLDRYLRKHHARPHVAVIRGAMMLAFTVRYAAARLAARRGLAEHYLASARALRAASHA